MNKGIVMEVKSDYAIIMNDSGYMEKIKNKKGMKIGEKIFYFEEDLVKPNNVVYLRKYSFMKAITSIAALLFIAFTFFYQISYREEAYAVVSLDINPSIQIEVDSNKNIIKVEGMNDDGKDLDYSGLEGLNIKDGIEKIKNQLVEKKYLEENKDVLVAFALVGTEEDDNYEETIKGAIKSSFKSETVTFVKGKQSDVAEAKSKGVSLGRYEASQMAGNDKDTLDKAPVKKITELIKDKDNVVQWNEESIKIDATPVDEELDKEEPVTNNENSSVNASTTQTPNVPHNNSNNINNTNGISGDNVEDTWVEKPEQDVTLNVEPDPKPSDELSDNPPEEVQIPDKELAKPSGKEDIDESLKDDTVPSIEVNKN